MQGLERLLSGVGGSIMRVMDGLSGLVVGAGAKSLQTV